MDFEIKAVTAADQEQAAAKAYWANREFQYYTRWRPWSDFIAERVLAFRPRSIFEFGCNAGKNLTRIAELAPDRFIAGIDVNREAVEFGRSTGLRLQVGDEHSLAVIPDRSFDVVFTVSVIDHIATPEQTLSELARISRKALLLLELWLGREGKVTRNFDPKTGGLIETTPFSYSWDYTRITSATLPDWKMEEEPVVLSSNLGQFYKLYTITPPLSQQGD